MAIILRTVTGSALSYEQLDTNFSSYYYSASISASSLTLFTTGSDALVPPSSTTIDIPSTSKWIDSGGGIQRTGLVRVFGPFAQGGGNAVAQGSYSHAQGDNTVASGTGSHAEGYDAVASGLYSHAEGLATVASGSYQHVQGQYNLSSSAQSAFIVGNGTSNGSRSNLIFASGSRVEITGSLNVSGGITGSLFGTASFSIATAVNATTASYATTWSGIINGNVQITGSLSQGAAGNIARATGSHAEGQSTIASGSYSHAEGLNTTASGDYSHAEGANTVTLGIGSHAEGTNTKALGAYTHAEGYQTTALGESSHAEGSNTLSSGNYSHAEGNNTQALGVSSHAEGTSTIASASFSHAEGVATYAAGIGQHVQGIYNAISTSPSAFIIGNGINAFNRRNLVFASGSQFQITGSLLVTGSAVVTGGITGSLLGTASFANSAYAIPAGTDTQLQYNNNGALAGTTNLTWNSVSNTLNGTFSGDGSQLSGLVSTTAQTATSASHATQADNAISVTGYNHVQSAPATTWTITHNLNNQFPIVQVYNASNIMMVPEVIQGTDVNTTTIQFSFAMAGYARIL